MGQILWPPLVEEEWLGVEGGPQVEEVMCQQLLLEAESLAPPWELGGSGTSPEGVGGVSQGGQLRAGFPERVEVNPGRRVVRVLRQRARELRRGVQVRAKEEFRPENPEGGRIWRAASSV